MSDITLTPAQRPPWLQNLGQGQRLQAVALENSRGGEFRVQLGSRQLTVRSTLSVNQGERLQLVTRLDQQGRTTFQVQRSQAGSENLRVQGRLSGLGRGTQITGEIVQRGSQSQLRLAGQPALPLLNQSEPGRVLLRVLHNEGQQARLQVLERLDASTRLLIPQAGGDRLQGIRDGQQLQVLALNSTSGGREQDLSVLINGQRLRLRTTLSVERGQTLTLRLENQMGRTALRLLASPGGGNASEATINSAWRSSFAMQGEPLLLFNASSQGNSPNQAEGSRQLRVLRQWLPLISQLGSATGLRSALLASGLFMEARLAHSSTQNMAGVLAGDYKALLLKLLGSRDTRADSRMPSPSGAASVRLASQLSDDLPGMVRSALSRLELLQLDNARHDGEQMRAELLARDEQQSYRIPLLIEREPQSHRHADDHDEERGWRLRFAADAPAFRQLRVQVVLAPDAALAVTLDARDPASRERLRKHRARLQERLQRGPFSEVAVELGQVPDFELHQSTEPLISDRV